MAKRVAMSPALSRSRRVEMTDGPLGEDAVALAIGGAVGDAALEGRGAAAERDFLAGEKHAPGPRRPHSGKRLDDARGAGTELARKADDLATAERKANRLRQPVGEQPVDREQGLAGHRAARRKHRLEIAAEHQGDDRVDVEFRRRLRRQTAAVPEDGDAVGDTEDLGQAVGDVDDAPPLAGEPLDDGEDALDLAVGERRGRLVEDEDAGIADEKACDLEELLLGDGEALDLGARINMVEADHGEELPGPGIQAAGPPEGGDAGLAEDEVLGDRHGRDGRIFLVDDGNAGGLGTGGRKEIGGAAVDLDGARIRLDQPGQHLDEGALAGTVLAEEGHHLAGAQLEIDLGQRLDVAVALGEAAHQKARPFDRASGFSAVRTRVHQTSASCRRSGPRCSPRSWCWRCRRRRSPGHAACSCTWRAGRHRSPARRALPPAGPHRPRSCRWR